ncbi:YkgJ family cysteine cluster protein, partial [Thermodesulfobacteriota bacterium]
KLIREQVKKITCSDNLVCPFLVDGACIIYDARPIICRTFGLPAIISADGGDKKDLIICEKNFTNKKHLLEEDYIINLDTLNSILFVVNSAFVNIHEEFDDEKERINVMDIVNYL